jgi:hypothetical protein
MDLSPAQLFELEQMRRAGKEMSRAQAQELLVQATRLLMIKTNVYRSLLHDQQRQSTSNAPALSGD